MGFSKYSLLLLLAAAFVAILWRFGRVAFTGATKWLLWALAALCAGSGLLVLFGAQGHPAAVLGGVMLWVFAAYMIRVAES